ncbi:MAG TPA: dihydrofolate reductase [Nevskiaceae bacterium]|nr:dihydrofolate reductase [Nevskiaceae bacterium]
MSRLALIAALDRRRVIGRAGALPWRLPDDLARFKRLTLGHTVLMGRKTWASLGRPLPGRANWVISRQAELALPAGVRRFESLEAALATAPEQGELRVIGGGELYQQTLPLADRLWLTEVETEVAEGDAWFPDWRGLGFVEVGRERHAADDRHAHAYAFVDYQRER